MEQCSEEQEVTEKQSPLSVLICLWANTGTITILFLVIRWREISHFSPIWTLYTLEMEIAGNHNCFPLWQWWVKKDQRPPTYEQVVKTETRWCWKVCLVVLVPAGVWGENHGSAHRKASWGCHIVWIPEMFLKACLYWGRGLPVFSCAVTQLQVDLTEVVCFIHRGTWENTWADSGQMLTQEERDKVSLPIFLV